jgi:hypothetical protein
MQKRLTGNPEENAEQPQIDADKSDQPRMDTNERKLKGNFTKESRERSQQGAFEISVNSVSLW